VTFTFVLRLRGLWNVKCTLKLLHLETRGPGYEPPYHKVIAHPLVGASPSQVFSVRRAKTLARDTSPEKITALGDGTVADEIRCDRGTNICFPLLVVPLCSLLSRLWCLLFSYTKMDMHSNL